MTEAVTKIWQEIARKTLPDFSRLMGSMCFKIAFFCKKNRTGLKKLRLWSIFSQFANIIFFHIKIRKVDHGET